MGLTCTNSTVVPNILRALGSSRVFQSMSIGSADMWSTMTTNTVLLAVEKGTKVSDRIPSSSQTITRSVLDLMMIATAVTVFDGFRSVLNLMVTAIFTSRMNGSLWFIIVLTISFTDTDALVTIITRRFGWFRVKMRWTMVIP